MDQRVQDGDVTLAHRSDGNAHWTDITRFAVASARVSFNAAGPLALGCRESGQVGNEAATAECHRCRGQGSPLPPHGGERALADSNTQEGVKPPLDLPLYPLPLLFHSRQPFSSGKYSPAELCRRVLARTAPAGPYRVGVRDLGSFRHQHLRACQSCSRRSSARLGHRRTCGRARYVSLRLRCAASIEARCVRLFAVPVPTEHAVRTMRLSVLAQRVCTRLSVRHRQFLLLQAHAGYVARSHAQFGVPAG